MAEPLDGYGSFVPPSRPVYDVFSEAAIHAERMRTFFEAYQNAGFSRDEAMELCVTLLGLAPVAG